MAGRGINHIGLVTNDMDGTVEFYRDVVGFKVARYDHIPVNEGGEMRHIFFDVGHGQFLSFIEPKVDGIDGPLDPGLNDALGVPRKFYHFAFEAGSEDWLRRKREDLASHGVDVTDVVDHEWCYSIYFDDPVNNLRLEFCAQGRDLTPEDAELKVRFTVGRDFIFNAPQAKPKAFVEVGA
jgi:catechol 2,3-dioxygenase-like lactoylglutathione lyase family enzyme